MGILATQIICKVLYPLTHGERLMPATSKKPHRNRTRAARRAAIIATTR